MVTHKKMKDFIAESRARLLEIRAKNENIKASQRKGDASVLTAEQRMNSLPPFMRNKLNNIK